MNRADAGSGPGFVAAVLRYYRISILIVVTLLVAGVWAFLTLPRSEDPEFDVFDCRVLVSYPGAGPDTVESLVTRPLEDAIDELDDIKAVESTSIAGFGLFRIWIEPDATPSDVVDEIRRKVDEVQPELPAGIDEPIVLKFNTAHIPVLIAALSGRDDLRHLDQWAQRISDELGRLPDVAGVAVEGIPERHILVEVDNERLAQLRIPLTHIREILGLENAAIPGGTLDVGPRRYVLRNPNELRSLDEILATPIAGQGDAVVELSDVATVSDGLADPRYLVRLNGRPALLLTVAKSGGSDTVKVADRARDALRRIALTLPDGLELQIVSDRGASVDQLLGNLGWNALGGGVIVILMVSVFLGIRQGLVVSVSIPLSVLIALVLMRVVGVGLHQVSIFGLVLALGMLVDSGLVVVENIGRHIEDGRPLHEAIVVGVREVTTPVVASVLTTVAAFVPLLFLEGNMGPFMRGMPLTVIFALTGSLLVAMTVIPLLCYVLWRALPPRPEPPHRSRALDVYTELAKWALRHRFVTLLLAVAVFGLSLSTLPVIGLQLFPKANKEFFFVNVRLPRDANLETTGRVATQVEEILIAEAAVRNVTTNLGKGSPLVYYNVEREREQPSFAQLLVNLDPGTPAEDYVPALQQKLRLVAGAGVEAKVFEQGPVGAAPIQIRVSGSDLDTLSNLAGVIREEIADVRGLTDVRDTLGERVPQLVLDLDRRKAALLGVDSFAFSRTIFAALNGEEATRYRTDDDEVPVTVRLDRRWLDEVSSLERIYLPSRNGGVVPFSEVARVREERRFAQIVRRDGRRSVTVEADVSGRLAEDALTEIEGLLGELALPEGYELSYGGEREEREESFAGLGRAMVLALLLIYGLLAIQFNSFRQPLVILLTVPFGLTGAFFGLLITGNPFGFMAFIGTVSLTGIIINDSIVLTEFANYLQRVAGMGRFEALLEAGRMRFRPVVLTSITTIGGLTPLAIWGGSLWSPLACAVIFGLMGATVLILIVLPVIYSLLVSHGEGRRALRAWATLQRRLSG